MRNRSVTGTFRSVVYLMSLSALVYGCRSTSKTESASSVEGFSANSNIQSKNAAVLMTSYGSTPGNGPMFEQDLSNFYAVITDPKADYRFDTTAFHQVGHDAMGSAIQQGAAKVSADGTLLVFITAHGAQSGVIQPADQMYATFGYENILANIRAARKDKGPFQRLVVVISACYSGSWLNTLSPSTDVARQRLVITSVNANTQSMIGSATNAMYQAFLAMKNNPNQTMGQFIASAQSYSGGMLQYSVNDNSILNEPLLNKTIDLANLLDNTTGIKLYALTQHVGEVDKLYLYASKDVSALYFVDGSKQPYACTVKTKAQDDWPYICTIQLKSGSGYMTGSDPIKMIFEYQDKVYGQEVVIHHQ